MGPRDRRRAVPPGERVEIALAAACVLAAYAALLSGRDGWLLRSPQLAAALLCLRLAWRHRRARRA